MEPDGCGARSDCGARAGCGARVGCGARAGCGTRAGCGVVHSRGQGSTVVHGPRVGVGPELVVRHGCGSSVHGVRAAWLCIDPGLVLRVGLIVDGDRSGCVVGLWG